MSCDLQENLPQITQNSSKTLNFSLTSQLTGRPFDISNASQVTASFLKADGTSLPKNLQSGVSILSGPGGSFSVDLDPADTVLMAPGNGDGAQSVIVDVVIAGKTYTKIFENSIKVIPRPF